MTTEQLAARETQQTHGGETHPGWTRKGTAVQAKNQLAERDTSKEPSDQLAESETSPRPLRFGLYAAHLAVVALAALAWGCTPTEKVVEPSGGTDCSAACVQLRAICAAQSCPDDVLAMSSPTPAGQACEVWRCAQGYPHEKNTCLAQARTPTEARACRGVGR